MFASDHMSFLKPVLFTVYSDHVASPLLLSCFEESDYISDVIPCYPSVLHRFCQKVTLLDVGATAPALTRSDSVMFFLK